MEWREQLGRLYGAGSDEIYVGDPKHMNWMADNSPRAEREWRETLIQRGVDFASSGLLRSAETHPLTKEFGGRTLRLPKGLAKVTSHLIARSFLPEEIFDENTATALEMYRQRDTIDRCYYDIVYLGGTQVGITRRFCFDPDLPPSVYQETEGYLSLLDVTLYEAIQKAHTSQDYASLPPELANKNLQSKDRNIQLGHANRKLLAGGVAAISRINHA